MADGRAPAPGGREREAAGEEAPRLWGDLVAAARAAMGARAVCLWRVEPGGATARSVARAVVGGGALREALQVARRVVPDLDPRGLEVRLDANPLLRRVAGGEIVAAPVAELGEGAVHPALLRAASGLAGLRHALVCPVTAGGRTWGALNFTFLQRPAARRLPACAAFARQAGLLLEGERCCEGLREQARQLQASRAMLLAAEDRLRQDIAEQLHGRVQARLIVAWHRLDECTRHLPTDPQVALALLEQVRGDLLDIQERDVRQASRRLHPAVIRLGLLTALSTLVDEFAGQLAVDLRADPDLRAFEDAGGNLPVPCALTLYRGVEEGLSNAARHAGARRAEVLLDLVAGRSRVRATVRDDGRGLEPRDVRPGLGLAAIAGRVEQVGGSWSLTGQQGRGATLTVEVPVPPLLRTAGRASVGTALRSASAGAASGGA